MQLCFRRRASVASKRSRRLPRTGTGEPWATIGATIGIRALLAATNGAAATMPVGPMTADPTPVPMVISVAGLAVARKTLPANRDDAVVLPTPSIGSIQALSIRGLPYGTAYLQPRGVTCSQCVTSLPTEVDQSNRASVVRKDLSDWVARYILTKIEEFHVSSIDEPSGDCEPPSYPGRPRPPRLAVSLNLGRMPSGERTFATGRPR